MAEGLKPAKGDRRKTSGDGGKKGQTRGKDAARNGLTQEMRVNWELTGVARSGEREN